jgi:2-oxoglutarate ferredoxin oxidoreductase subunit beta
MSGDGDCLAIGGNHFIHEIRRNVDLNICMFNNRIYGLTKGQYSPTSPKGFVSKSSPFGTVERPFVPAELVLGARGTFFARTLDVDVPTTVDCLVAAQQHKGASVVECLVNCVIFNNGTHAWIADREQRAEHSIILRHGEKMIFGKNNDKGIALKINDQTVNGQMGNEQPLLSLMVVDASDPRVLVHDAHQQDPTLHRLLALMGQERNLEVNAPSLEQSHGDSSLPIALGVIRDVEAETYDQAVNRQIAEVRDHAKAKTFDQLTATLEQWCIEN